MEKLGVFKKYRDDELLFVSWADTLEDAKKQIEQLVKSNGNVSYFVQDFRDQAVVWSWSPDATHRTGAGAGE